jgi:hypothetical protein
MNDALNNATALPTRVNITDMLARVKKTEYFLMQDNRTTFCALEMENGYTVWGKSACVDPKEYNQALGEKYAHEDAIRNLWPLEGYLLAERRSINQQAVKG